MANRVRGIRQSLPANIVIGRGTGKGGPAQTLTLPALANAMIQSGAIPLPGGGFITAVDSNFTVTAGTLSLHTTADGNLLANIAGSTAEPIANTLTAVLDHVMGNTKGDTLYRDTSVWKVLAPGSNGQVLTLASGIPSWATGGGSSFTNQGAWSGTVAYNPFDVVQDGGSSWLNFAAISAPAAGTVTLDTTNKVAAVTLSAGNLKATMGSGTGGGTSQTTVTATAGVTNKLYFEVVAGSLSNNATGVGICIASGMDLTFGTTHQYFNCAAIGTIFNGNTSSGFSFGGWSGGVVGAIAIDFSAKLLWVASSAASPNWNQGTSGTQNPSTGAGGIPFDTAFNGLAMVACYFMGTGSGENWTFNFGTTSFTGTLPTGFSSWDSLATGSPNAHPSADDSHWLSQGSGGGLTVGSTTIASGTSGRVLYDNSGVLGELTVTGTGSVVLSGSPTLTTPALGTPSALVLTNATGLPLGSITGFGTGIATALAINTGSAGAPVLFGGAGGTPSSLTLTNATGLPAASVVAGALAAGMTATTQTAGDNSTKLATTAYVDGTYDNTGSWTPSDQSGASLTFTSVSANYTKIGNMVFAYAQLTYPSTADGTTALIGGFPFTAANANYAKNGFNFVGPVTTHALSGIIVPNSKTFHVYDNGAGSFYINSQLSTVTLIFMAIYPVA